MQKREQQIDFTKSGILGLLACAMGLPRNSEEILRLHQDVCLGIRADRQSTAISGRPLYHRS